MKESTHATDHSESEVIALNVRTNDYIAQKTKQRLTTDGDDSFYFLFFLKCTSLTTAQLHDGTGAPSAADQSIFGATSQREHLLGTSFPPTSHFNLSLQVIEV